MTNNHKILATAALVLAIVGSSLSARVVISKKKQEEVIQTAREMLSNTTEIKEPVWEVLNDPFHRHVEEVAEPVKQVVEEVTVVAETVVEPDPTESEILDMVAQKLKPSGFIDQGGQQYLILNGRKVQDGVSFNFPHRNKRYAIEITEIQTNSFTLNLNSESKTISME